MSTIEEEIARVLPDAEMRALGFTDHREGYWYYVTRVGSNTTLNISINKATGGYTERVLDEFFGQYEMYGRMMEPYRTAIRDNIDRELDRLNAADLQVRVDHAEYGWSEGVKNA